MEGVRRVGRTSGSRLGALGYTRTKGTLAVPCHFLNSPAMTGSSSVKSATRETAPIWRSLARVCSISMLEALLAMHVKHVFAVKSTSTGWPSLRACSTASGLHGFQSIPDAEDLGRIAK